jgi:SAM-dependent methyltransferase
MGGALDPRRVVAQGYDQLGPDFAAWNTGRPSEVRRWFRREVLARLPKGSRLVELGCGPGTDTAALAGGRRYVGIDLSREQLAIARRRVPNATFVLGDFTSMAFRPASFDGVVAFYVFMHVPHGEHGPTFERIWSWLRPGGRLMLSLPMTEAEDRVEDWLDVPMFFAGTTPGASKQLLRETGFDIDLSAVRGEGVDDGYGPVQHHWVIARKPRR